MPEAVRCRISRGPAALWLGAVGFMTVMGIPLLLITIIRNPSDAPPILLVAWWLGTLAWFWYVLLVWISYEVRLSPTGEMEFKSVLRTVRRDARQLAHIEAASAFDPYTVVFKFLTGKSRTVRQMEGFVDLIRELKQLNPNIQLRGL
jgi:hypothetical protein